MKKIFLALALLCFAVSCAKGPSSQVDSENPEMQAENEGDPMISRYRAAIYKEPELKNWAATLSKAEHVNVLEQIEGEEPVSRVRLSDGTEGYIKSSYLATKAVVIITEGTAAYNRNNLTSGQVGLIPAGVIAMVTEEMGEWLKISIGELPDGTKIYNRWINAGYSDDQELISDAALYEYSRDVLSGNAKGDEKIAKKSLETLSSKQNVIGQLASAALSGSAVEAYEYAEGSQLAKVIAGSDLKLRKEPSKDSDEIMIIPSGSTVAVLEESGDEVELSGKTGKWKRINFRGTEGWAFGGFLE